MTRTILGAVTCGFLLTGSSLRTQDALADELPRNEEWKAGVASVRITPDESMWMAGYASRNKPSEGTARDLFAKALAIEDTAGTRLVIVTLDLIGVPRALRDTVAAQAETQYRLPPKSLLINASHTHCGPELRASKASLYGLDDERVRQATEYLQGLERKLVSLIGNAIERLAPAKLGYSHARCGFAMNRRLPTANGYQNSPYPEGPVDHDVPVLRVEDPDGKLRAVLFGYACHNTTLSFYEFCGDYAGYAQEYIEAEHPGATALFMLGCGGDQNPYPRGKLEQAQQHGRSLANAVEAALLPKPRPVGGPLRLALDEVELQFAPPPTREELDQLKESKDAVDRRRAERLLDELDRNGKIRDTYSYPIQAVRIGDDLLLVALAGETVVDFSLRLKRELAGPAAVWIAGYSNDVFGYVPSLRVLREGGYEGGGAMRFSSLPGPFAESVEERIIGKVHELVARVRGETGVTLQRLPSSRQDMRQRLGLIGAKSLAPQTNPNSVRVAGIVLKWIRGDKEANFRRIEPMIHEAAAGGAKVIVTTECFLDGYAIADKSIPLDEYRSLGEPIPDGKFYRQLAALADELNVYLIAGMLEADGAARYNTAVLIGPDGRLLGKYHKQMLEHELVRNTAGSESPSFATPFGRAGLMICADRRDQSIVERLRATGAEFLICLSGGMFGPKSNDHILQARSRENQTHIVFVHPAEFLVTGPDGSILARTLLGDRLLINVDQEGTDMDKNGIFYFDLPVSPTRAGEEQFFVARPLTESGRFTEGIEGPQCDAAGNIYAVNFERQGTIGRVTPDGKGEVFVELPNKSVGNGIVFDRSGTMYVADYVNHNILAIDPKTREVAVYAHSDEANQPNDLAIAADGTIYASDPNWGNNTGQIWRIGRDRKFVRIADKMGTTNGIEVSPDGKTLFVNESVQRNIWAFTIDGDLGAPKLADKRLLIKFDDHGFDGMRCDIEGNLYITRYGKGTVAVVNQAGKVIREIDVLGKQPSNLCFGGPDGRTVYVTEVEHRRIVQFRVDRPGLAWQRWQK
jgi:sugar lactone lactonase YvrE/predicted amidohydrolase